MATRKARIAAVAAMDHHGAIVRTYRSGPADSAQPVGREVVCEQTGISVSGPFGADDHPRAADLLDTLDHSCPRDQPTIKHGRHVAVGWQAAKDPAGP